MGKLAKRAAKLENFAPRVAKAARDGRNTVSADRALKGQRVVSEAFKDTVSSGSASEKLGAVSLSKKGQGNFPGRGAGANLANKNNMAKTVVTGSSDKEIRKQALQSDNVIRRAKSIRSDLGIGNFRGFQATRPTPIQFNNTGYNNPSLRRSISKPTPPRPPKALNVTPKGYRPMNMTFGDSSLNGAAAILAGVA